MRRRWRGDAAAVLYVARLGVRKQAQWNFILLFQISLTCYALCAKRAKKRKKVVDF